jgi:hypothetical protein
VAGDATIGEVLGLRRGDLSRAPTVRVTPGLAVRGQGAVALSLAISSSMLAWIRFPISMALIVMISSGCSIGSTRSILATKYWCGQVAYFSSDVGEMTRLRCA